jgi:glycosyltransferase involved in cell wall biosynthesis
MQRRLLVIIPCYNEAASIGNLLTDLAGTTLPGGWQADILVVNDSSKDDTAAVVRQYPVHLLDLSVNLGIGGAMQSGYRFALLNNYDAAVQMDGDGQHPPGELYKLLDCFESTKANVVIGSRFLKKGGFRSSRMRRWGIRYFHWLNKFFTGKRIYDSTSGFRLFDKPAIKLAAKYYPDEYPEPESIVIFARAGLKIAETAVVMRERQGGTSSIRYWSTLYYCIKVTIAMFFSFIRKTVI